MNTRGPQVGHETSARSTTEGQDDFFLDPSGSLAEGSVTTGVAESVRPLEEFRATEDDLLILLDKAYTEKCDHVFHKDFGFDWKGHLDASRRVNYYLDFIDPKLADEIIERVNKKFGELPPLLTREALTEQLRSAMKTLDGLAEQCTYHFARGGTLCHPDKACKYREQR